jgi:hypothetical protein
MGIRHEPKTWPPYTCRVCGEPFSEETAATQGGEPILCTTCRGVVVAELQALRCEVKQAARGQRRITLSGLIIYVVVAAVALFALGAVVWMWRLALGW